MCKLHFNATVMVLNWWWLKFYYYSLDVGTKNALVLYILSKKNKSMKISNFKLRVVIILVYNSIESLPCSLRKAIHQLVRIYMNSTAINVCAKWTLFSKKKITWYTCKSPDWNITVCSVVDHSGSVTVNNWFYLDHHTSEILI